MPTRLGASCFLLCQMVRSGSLIRGRATLFKRVMGTSPRLWVQFALVFFVASVIDRAYSHIREGDADGC